MAAQAVTNKPFIELTTREVCLLLTDLRIDCLEEVITRGSITGALLATVTSKDELKNPPFSIPINDRIARDTFNKIQDRLIYGVEPEEIHVNSKLLFLN